MFEIVSVLVYIIIIFGVTSLLKIKKTKSGNFGKGESSAMPHEHRPAGVHDTFNKKSSANSAGAQPHRHETKKFTSMSDASKLPPGYILLNGEPVKVSDLDNK